jgi:hypothetical protein
LSEMIGKNDEKGMTVRGEWEKEHYMKETI